MTPRASTRRPGRRTTRPPPLSQSEDYDAALYLLTAQTEFYELLDADGDAATPSHLTLVLAPTDATGTLGAALLLVHHQQQAAGPTTRGGKARRTSDWEAMQHPRRRAP